MDDAEVEAAYLAPAREALEAFPITEGTIALAALSENVTFRVTDADTNQTYCLRLHRPGYHTLEELNSERLWTSALNEFGVRAPIPVPARDGRYFVPVEIPLKQEARFVGVTQWTEGELLSNVLQKAAAADRTAHFAILGSTVAKMHNQARAWRPPSGFVRHHLDAEGLLGDAPFWGRFWDHPVLAEYERRQLMEAREKVRVVLARLGRENYSVIHADLHPGNVLIGGDALTVIDFDDAGWGWHLYDIAVALVRQQETTYFADIESAFVQGYRSVRPLPQTSRALIPMFLMIRDMASLGWRAQRPEIDKPDYLEALRTRVCRAAARFEPPPTV